MKEIIRGLTLFLLWAACVTGGTTQPVTRAQPNVLFIALDDLNDWVGPLGGHPQVKTPHLDRLARRGTTFLNAHCQAPLCNPSRTSLLTGLRPTTTGVYALEPWFRESPKHKTHVTLPQHFMQNGYRVLATGKIFHDAYPPANERKDGSEVTTWGVRGGFTPRPAKKFVTTPDDIALMDWGAFPARDEDCYDADLADWAVAQLKDMPRGNAQPTFLAVGLRHPHVPLYAPRKWFDLYPEDKLIMPPIKENDRADIPPFAWYLHWRLPEPRWKWTREAGQDRNIVRAYLASVSYADYQVGRILDALEASGQSENTIVVLWGDHGWHLGEKGITGKNTLWERSTRVPLIFAGPGVAKNARTNQPAELLDLYPTLAALCGLPARPGLDGHSLAPQLKNAAATRAWPAITSQGPGNHTVRTDKWRYIRYADDSEELYDMRRDPNEWTNLASGKQYAAIKRELAKWMPAASATPMPGSKSRLIELRDGKVYWETKPVDAPGNEESK
ncbi:MAG: sulfatase [Blastocatellia bacterium]